MLTKLYDLIIKWLVLDHVHPNMTHLSNELCESHCINLINKQVVLGLKSFNTINKHIIFVLLYIVEWS